MRGSCLRCSTARRDRAALATAMTVPALRNDRNEAVRFVTHALPQFGRLALLIE
jgi:hypothetical protein